MTDFNTKGYMNYLLSLPQPASEEHKKRLLKAERPFVVGKENKTLEHYVCKACVWTKVIRVYVPLKDIIVEEEIPHYFARDPVKACEQAFRKILLKQGRSKKMVDIAATLIFNQERAFDSLPYEKRLLVSAEQLLHSSAAKYRNELLSELEQRLISS